MMRRYQRVSNSVPRHNSQAPTSAAAIMKKPMAEHDAEGEEHRLDRRPVLRRHVLEADDEPLSR